MKTLGTILPDMKKLAIADEFCDRQKMKDQNFGDKKFGKNNRRFVQGEDRWYTDDTHYSVINNGTVKNFEVRADGDYSIK